jgi:heat-inducible transcriptional repressor
MSSATLRNIMAGLEADGYLTHPHTSAGRTPTALGYRYYADAASKQLSLSLIQRRNIIDFFAGQVQIEELFRQTCEFLARITPYLGVVSKYSNRKFNLKHIDLVPLSSNHLLLVAITTAGEVFKVRVRVSKFDFNVSDLELVLNKELVGLELAQIKDKYKHLRALGLFGNLFNEVAFKLIELLESQQSDVYYDGVSNLLNFPEFAQLSLLSSIFTVLQDAKSTLRQISTNFSNDDLYIAIGNELKDLALSEASLIAVPYYLNDQLAGSVTIIGPMRMDYEKAIATTECVAGNLTLSLQKMAYG